MKPTFGRCCKYPADALTVAVMVMTFSVISLSSVSPALSSPAESSVRDSIFGRYLAAHASGILRIERSPTMAISIVDNGHVVFSSRYAQTTSTDLRLPLKPLYGIGVIRGQVDTIAILMLAGSNRLHLSDKVSAYLDGVGDPNMTIRDAVVKTAYGTLINQQSGETDFQMIDDIISKASKMPARDFITTRILKPDGMTDTYFGGACLSDPGLTSPNSYGLNPDRVPAILPLPRTITWSDSNAMCSTADDIALLDRSIMANKLVSWGELRALIQTFHREDDMPWRFGGGFFVDETFGMEKYGTCCDGYSGVNQFSPDGKTAVIILSNSENWYTGPEVAASLMRLTWTGGVQLESTTVTGPSPGWLWSAATDCLLSYRYSTGTCADMGGVTSSPRPNMEHTLKVLLYSEDIHRELRAFGDLEAIRYSGGFLVDNSRYETFVASMSGGSVEIIVEPNGEAIHRIWFKLLWCCPTV